MRVSFQRTGGFAGIRLRAEIDSDSLSQEEQRQLSQLVEASGLLDDRAGRDRDSRANDRRPRPDAYRYRISIDSGDRQRTVELSDRELSPAIEELIDWLRRHARQR